MKTKLEDLKILSPDSAVKEHKVVRLVKYQETKTDKTS